jgi:hypothetical protein
MRIPDEQQAAILRRLTGAERVRIATEMSEAARELMLAGIRARHPGWSRARAQEEYTRSVIAASRSRIGR